MDYKSNLKETEKSITCGNQAKSYNLFDAVDSGSTKVINLFLKNNAELPSEILKMALECKNFNIEVIKLLLARGVVLQPDICQIAFRARKGNCEVIKLILENGAEISDSIINDVVRSKDCNIEILKLLLERGAELSSCVLDDALKYGYVNCEVIKLLLEKGTELSHSSLYHAVVNKYDVEIIKLLLERGATLQTDILQIAFQVGNGNSDIIKLLLENNAEVSGSIVSDVVGSKGCNIETLKLLLERGAELPSDVLDHALKYRYINHEVIKLLLQNGAELSHHSLSYAVVFKCDIEVLKVLLKWGVDVPSDILEGAFEFQNFNFEIVKLLLENGAEPSCLSLNYAVRSCNVDVIKLLLERGAEPESDVIKIAIELRSSNMEIIILLIKNCAKMPIDVINYAVKFQCCIKVIKLLLERGAELPWDILRTAVCLNTGNSELIKFLLEKGAKFNGTETDLINYVMLSTNSEFKIKIFKLFIEYGLNVSKNKNIFKHLEINSANINLYKSLSSYMLLRLIVNNQHFFNVDIFDRSRFSSIILYHDMLHFFGYLKNELLKMKNDKIGQDSTLLSFLSQRCSSAPLFGKTDDFLVEEVLSRYHTGKYAYSVDLLYSSLSKYEIINKIYKLDICAIKKTPFENVNCKIVSLNYNIISYLASYLSKTDCFHLMIAFWPKDDLQNAKHFYEVNKKLKDQDLGSRILKDF